jgi:hypothetical protein
MSARDRLTAMYVPTSDADETEWEQRLNAYRAEIRREQGLEDQEALEEAAAMYRALRPVIEATMADSSRWDGDESEEFHLGRYVQWLAAGRAQVRTEALAEAADELDRIAEHYGPSAQALRDAAGNVRYMARKDTREGEPTTATPDFFQPGRTYAEGEASRD